jgi:hypothetical protein
MALPWLWVNVAGLTGGVGEINLIKLSWGLPLAATRSGARKRGATVD